MKKLVLSGLLLATTTAGLAFAAEETAELPPMPNPTPTKEHQWLQQLVGDWTSEAELYMAPGQPPTECKGTEMIRALGPFWTVGEMKSSIMGTQFTGMMTLGYDPEKGKFIGTWIDSMNHHMWKYEGTLDEAKNMLILESEGPNMMEPGKTAKYRDLIEVKSKDLRVMTSEVQSDGGEWVLMMKAEYRRKGTE